MPSIFGLHSISNACLYNRIRLPIQKSKPLDIELMMGTELPKNGGSFDCLMVHGCNHVVGMLEYLRWKVRGKKLIWAVDDDYLNIPEWNPVKLPEEYLEFHQLATCLADYIVCSTSHLASKFKRQNVLVGPNLIDMARFSHIQKNSASEKVKILWQGSTTHKKDIEIIVPVLSEILEEYKGKVEVVFWGDSPPISLYTRFSGRGLSIKKQVKIDNYHTQLTKISPDIVLAPLVDCEFNKSKSNLRVIEGWAIGATVIASQVGEYEKTIRHNHDGLLFNCYSELIEQLHQVIKDKQYRNKLGQAGRTRVEEDFNWDNPICRKQWDTIFEKVVK